MKKLLILAYDFPPYVSVGGMRPGYWYKTLNEWDVESVVVTRQWAKATGAPEDYIRKSESSEVIVTKDEHGMIIGAPYRQSLSNRLLLKYGSGRFKLLRKINTAFLEIAQYFLPVGTKRPLYGAADDFLKNEKVDFIIATGDPFILFHYAAKLGKKHSIPWIADYRDLWSHYTENQGGFFHKFERNREKAIIPHAALFTTVSEVLASRISELTGNKNYAVIPNGFDPDAVEKAISVEQKSDILTIAYAGTVYDWHPLERFLEGFNLWVDNHPEARFRLIFYGLNNPQRLQDALRTFPSLSESVSCMPKIANEVMLKRLRESNILFVFNNYAYMGTKIYDYLALHRKIVLCFENDPVAEELKQKRYFMREPDLLSYPLTKVITETKSGIIVRDIDDMQVQLDKLYHEFTQTGKVACESVDTEQFSRRFQARKLAMLLHELADKNRT